MVVAKVDAEAENSRSTAEAHGIRSYPTIKFFPKGSTTPVAYEGGRTAQALTDYINEKAGTNRLVGGALNAKAGTIEALDTILATLTGSNLDTVSKDVTATAKDLKDKYAKYYVKVVDKLSKTPAYAETELKRLEGILKKGNMAQDKVDDVTSRANILRKFIAGEKTAQEVKDEL